jgi:hypothetical protein
MLGYICHRTGDHSHGFAGGLHKGRKSFLCRVHIFLSKFANLCRNFHRHLWVDHIDMLIYAGLVGRSLDDQKSLALLTASVSGSDDVVEIIMRQPIDQVRFGRITALCLAN